MLPSFDGEAIGKNPGSQEKLIAPFPTPLDLRSRSSYTMLRNCSRVQGSEASKAELPEILEVVSGDNAKKMYETGDLDAGIISCGQGIGFAKDIPSVKELFYRIVSEASCIAGDLAGPLSSLAQ